MKNRKWVLIFWPNIVLWLILILAGLLKSKYPKLSLENVQYVLLAFGVIFWLIQVFLLSRDLNWESSTEVNLGFISLGLSSGIVALVDFRSLLGAMLGSIFIAVLFIEIVVSLAYLGSKAKEKRKK